MYLSNRFFWLFGASAVLFALAYPFGWLFPIAQTAFVGFLALSLTDWMLLFLKKPKVLCKRETSLVYSLSDPNPVKVFVENQGNIFLQLSITDELPLQFQKRDHEIIIRLQAGQAYLAEDKLVPLTRGVYHFGNINVFVSTRLGLVERRLIFHQQQSVDVYPSIIQMKQFELRAMRHIAHDTGIKKMRRIGHSYEFEQIKNYVQGDDFRSINWKASRYIVLWTKAGLCACLLRA